MSKPVAEPLYRPNNKRIAEEYWGYIRQLTEPLTPAQQTVLDFLYNSTPTEQRKYLIINDELIKTPWNKRSYTYSLTTKEWRETTINRPEQYKKANKV